MLDGHNRFRALAVPAALLLTLAVAAGCTEKNKPAATAGTNATASAAATAAGARFGGSSGQTGSATAQSGSVPAQATSSAASAQGTAAATRPAATVTRPATASGSPASSSASNDTVNVVNQLRPSVVRVRTEASQIGAFGTAQKAQGTGTGLIIDAQGHVLTNNHVVTLGTDRVASALKVDLYDGTTVDATLVGREPAADLAVLQINAKNLTPAKFADPASIQVGQDVVAIGYALDLGSTPTVTKGVVSALNRQIDETIQTGQFGQGVQNSIGGAIQTDAAINPGNSGGPLANMNAEVIGINTAGIFSQNGEPVQGINFAVSVETIQPVIKALIDKGKVDRGYMGIVAQPITPDVASAQHLPVNDGVGVQQVTSGSAADQAGLKAGDIITKINDREIHSYGDLQQALILYGPGTKIHVEFYRGTTKQSADVTLGSRPAGA